MKKKIKDLVFRCEKCGHLLFISGTSQEKIQKIATLDKFECPNCGEERYENWLFVRTGDYEKEYGEQEIEVDLDEKED